ncbi:hypothetical protein [uncultured Campylobacter sp.]|uniref:hypothetical protein n=1 Tax=uncultured Campylobacter sp. TaxID=218934 RepID=UPI00261B717E|nr:hypothetical protein [uncultured Campylobacter sp.]
MYLSRQKVYVPQIMQIIARDRARCRKIRSVRKFQVAKDRYGAVSKTGSARGSVNLSSVARAASMRE